VTRTASCSLILGSLLAAITLATPRPGAGQGSESPAEMVRRQLVTVLQVLDDATQDAASRRAVLGDRIARSFDFDDMSQSILAVHWKDATDSQRARFRSLLRVTLESKSLSVMRKRTTEIVTVGGERIRGDRATVIVTVERDKGIDIPLLLKLKRTVDGWKIYDASLEGFSLLQHFRKHYAEIAASEGIAGVLAHMEATLAG